MRMIAPPVLARLVLLAVVLAPSSLRAEGPPPLLVTSIAPLHSLASGVMKGVGKPELLMSAQASPHDFSLKPSQARLMQKADLVLWIGPQMESVLSKPLKGAAETGRLLTVSEILGIRLLQVREGGPWDAHDHDHDLGAKGRKHDEADALEVDGHLWLDVANAKLTVQALASRLSALDPANGERYRRNAQDLLASLDKLDESVKREVAGLSGKPFVVHHDAFQYFETRYGLNGAGSITLEERQPSAKQLAAMKRKVSNLKAVCVFKEPQAPATLARLVAEGTSARLDVLDDLGSGLTPGAGLYADLLMGIARNLKRCLAGSAGG